MADKPTTGTVPMNSAAVKQHHRMAAGVPITGQTQPSTPVMPKTPA